VPFAADEIDLENWLYNMSDRECQGAARRAAEETLGFAADLTRKLQANATRLVPSPA